MYHKWKMEPLFPEPDTGTECVCGGMCTNIGGGGGEVL